MNVSPRTLNNVANVSASKFRFRVGMEVPHAGIVRWRQLGARGVCA
jgi:hypothetical protein